MSVLAYLRPIMHNSASTDKEKAVNQFINYDAVCRAALYYAGSAKYLNWNKLSISYMNNYETNIFRK